MTTTAPTSVPYSRLVLSDEVNVRKPSNENIDELAAMIKAKGLLRPLIVSPADGSDKLEITGGGRRYKAIGKLIKAGDWPKKQPVPVIIRNETDVEALDTSMMDNASKPMHPIDQHEAYARLAGGGMTVPDIAARYGIAERTVRQQMALGKLHPEIRKAWKNGKIDAETAKAFACSNDPERQLAAFKAAGSHITAYSVRRGLMGDRVAATGIPQRTLDLYAARGGTLTDDLFEHARYIDNPLLLAAVRREITAGLLDELRAEGWGWVAMADDLPEEWDYDWDKLEESGEPTPQEAAELEKLKAQRQVKYGSPEFLAARERIQDINDAIIMRGWTMEQRATAGAVITIQHDGGAFVDRGIIKPDGADVSALSAQEAKDATDDLDDGDGWETCPDCGGVDSDDCETCGGGGKIKDDYEDLPPPSALTGTNEADTSPDSDPFAISGALMETITTSQTNAAAEVLRHFHDVDLLLRLTLANLKSKPWGRPIKLSATPYQGAGNARGDFVDVLARMNKASTDELLAWLAAELADAMDLRSAKDQPSDDITALIQTLKPDAYLDAIRREFIAADYFKRATKATALAAIDELIEAGCGGGLAPVDVLADMKKADLAEVAALRATACGWLPPQLRHPAYALATTTKTEQAA